MKTQSKNGGPTDLAFLSRPFLSGGTSRQLDPFPGTNSIVFKLVSTIPRAHRWGGSKVEGHADLSFDAGLDTSWGDGRDYYWKTEGIVDLAFFYDYEEEEGRTHNRIPWAGKRPSEKT